MLLRRGYCFATAALSTKTPAMNSGAAASAAASCNKNDAPTSKAALIFLHGLGDTPAGWSSLRHSLPALQPSLQNVQFVFPPAPIIPISINGNSRMPGWFDLYDWPIGISAKDDHEGLMRSVEQIRQQVQTLVTEHGIPKDRIVLGGFSQGGAVAMLAAYTDPDRYAGCVALSGWLTLHGELQVSPEAKRTPLFWGHGTYDDKVLFEQQAHGIQVLKDKGVASIQHEQYDIGHSSDDDEIKAAAAFLESVLYSKVESASD
jgi:predicted esterase